MVMTMTQPVVPGSNKIAWVNHVNKTPHPASIQVPGPLKPSQTELEPKGS